MHRTLSFYTILSLLIAIVICTDRHKIGLLDEDQEDLEFEQKAGLIRDIPIRTNALPNQPHLHHEGHAIKRYKCLACEPPNCLESKLGTHYCQNAVQCWKSRVRDGKKNYLNALLNEV